MKKYQQALAIAFLACVSMTATAQGTIVFTAEATDGVESIVPRLTWNTEPAAMSCFASGDWSGPKGPSGDETLAEITSSATYALTCNWGALGSATLSWTTPTLNTDGTPLTDLDSFNIYYGIESGNYPNSVTGVSASLTSLVVENLAAGEWFFVGTSVNTAGIESEFSNEASKTIPSLDLERVISITINKRPEPMGELSTQ